MVLFTSDASQTHITIHIPKAHDTYYPLDMYSYGLVNLIERMLLQDGKRRPSAKEIEAECTKARCEVERVPRNLND